jgi:DNA-binding transcriptional LysR family regulator
MEQLDLDALSFFVATARHGGVNAASREIGAPKATISRRVRALEKSLGILLFERDSRRVALTDEGRKLFERTAPLLADLFAAGAEVNARDGQIRGHLRISVPAVLARFGIGGLAASFLERYPEVTLEIDAVDRFVDPVAEGYDLVVRANPAPNSDLVGKCFLRTKAVLAAAPLISMPQADDAEIPAVVLSTRRGRGEWTVVRDGRSHRFILKEHLVCSSMMLVYESVCAGAGAGMMPAWLISDDVAAGRLVVWGEMAGEDISAWVLHPPSHLTSPKVTAFIEALVDAFGMELNNAESSRSA